MLSIIHSDARCPYVIVGLNYSHLALLETTQTCTRHLHVHHGAQAVNKKRHFGAGSQGGNVMKRESGSLNRRVTHKDRSNTYRLTHTHHTHTRMHACSLTVMGGNRQGTNEVQLRTCLPKTGIKKTARACCLSPQTPFSALTLFHFSRRGRVSKWLLRETLLCKNDLHFLCCDSAAFWSLP